ncbi:MAG: hypothetical protein V3R26_04315 [Hyphomicrobium sp.]
MLDVEVKGSLKIQGLIELFTRERRAVVRRAAAQGFLRPIPGG